MTDYLFQEVPVFDRLGVNLMLARGQRIDVLDSVLEVVSPGLKQQGQPVPYVTTDQLGRATFTTTQGFVRLRSPKGLERIVYSPQYLSEVKQAAVDAASAASSAASSASSAAASAGLVGAPAGAAVDARLSSGPGLVVAATATVADVQAALDTAAANGKRAVASGTITGSTTLVIKSDCDLTQLTYNYTGTGIAVQVGAGGVGVRIDRKQVRLPSIVHTGKTALGWAGVAGTTGVRIVNANTCDIVIPFVSGFETGVEFRAETAGHVYCDYRLGHIFGCKYALRFTADGSGWVNQNTLRAGRTDLSSTEGTRAAGSRAVLMENATNAFNGNTFVGIAFEGDQWDYTLEIYGMYNMFVGCRWEAAAGARVWWRGNATRNKILDGYGTPVPTTDGTAARNEIAQTGSSKNVIVSSTSGVFNMQNDSSGAAPAWTVMDPAVSLYTNDPATKYAWANTALLLKGKRGNDTNDRIQIDANNARVLFGDGTVAPTTYFGWDSTGLLKINAASVYPVTSNTHDLGINSNRWRYARLGTGVVVGAFATGSRPNAATGGIGTMIFDSTLNKPIWSTGSAWVDATGTVV